MRARQTPTLTILYMYCTGGTEYSCSMCCQNTVRGRPENLHQERTHIDWIEDCEGWCLSGCHGSVAEHWRLKPEVSWVQLLVVVGLFYFCLITSKFISFKREARCSEHIAVSFHPMLLDAGNNHLAAHSTQTPAEQDIPFPGISGGTSKETVFALTKPDKKLHSILPNVNIYY